MKSLTNQSLGRVPPEYEIRQFRPGDHRAFLSLYETVFGHERDEEWFHWKYEQNPFVDHIPIFVAEHQGTVVGCRAFFPLEMRIGDEDRIAYQPCDTMVHPDHRRKGLFTHMNRRALEHYRDRSPSFFFNFPNERSREGNVALGWREIGSVPMYYRPQNPFAAAKQWTGLRDSGAEPDTRGTRRRPRTIERTLADVSKTAHRVHDRLLTDATTDLRIERHEEPPIEALETVYRRSIPDGIHTKRTTQFYRWRLSNPATEYVTYIAERRGSPVVAILVSHTADRVQLIDVLPRPATDTRVEIESLLEEVLSVYADCPLLTTFGDVLPRPIQYRFYPDTWPPLSTLIRPTTRTLFVKDHEPEMAIETSKTTHWALSRLDLDTT